MPRLIRLISKKIKKDYNWGESPTIGQEWMVLIGSEMKPFHSSKQKGSVSDSTAFDA